MAGPLKTQPAEDLRIELAEPLSAADAARLEEGLEIHRLSATATPVQDFGFVIRNKKGDMIGGMDAAVLADVFFVQKLWVADTARGLGLGRRLMERAEQEAIARGCRRITVDTMTYQAPDFYRKLGYGVKAIVANRVDGHDRIFLEKALC
jgi:GNAT superfamily N-acetyltransferase